MEKYSMCLRYLRSEIEKERLKGSNKEYDIHRPEVLKEGIAETTLEQRLVAIKRTTLLSTLGRT